jgi:uncharacterized protein YndB with AHSA1/START domain
MKKNELVIVKKSYPVTRELLWAALTEKEQMVKWFFNQIEDFKPIPGFKTSFVVENGRRTFPHNWEVKEIIPQKKLVINWNYLGYVGDSNVILEISSDNNESTLLTLTHLVLESFSSDIPEFKIESCKGGWEYFLGDSLPKFLKEINAKSKRRNRN